MSQKIMAKTAKFYVYDLQKIEDSKCMVFGSDYVIIQPHTVGCTLHLANNRYLLQKNQLVLLAPFNPFRLSFNNDYKQELSKLGTLHFRLHALGQTFVDSVQFLQIRQMLDLAKHGLLFEGELVEDVRAILTSMRNSFEFTEVLKLLQILNLLSSHEPNKTLIRDYVEINTSQRAEDRLHIALEYIEKNLSEPLSVSMVSNKIHMAGSTFSRFFHSNKGITFRQYLIEQRVKQAARYLVNTDWGIAQIGAEVGFSSLSNFNAKFKLLLRVTPKQYRSNHLDMRNHIDSSPMIKGQVQRQFIKQSLQITY